MFFLSSLMCMSYGEVFSKVSESLVCAANGARRERAPARELIRYLICVLGCFGARCVS